MTHEENSREIRWPKPFEYERQILVAGRLSPGERRITGGWRVPQRENEVTFSPVDGSTALTEAGVSRDELTRWHKSDWISEELATTEKFDRPQLFELAFVRDVVRSGLSDAQITYLLGQLPKPYWYDSSQVAYSFHYGWVQLPLFFEEKTVRDTIDTFIEDWIREKMRTDPDRLESVQEFISDALENAHVSDIDEPEKELEQEE
jgi:hypothetical protein